MKNLPNGSADGGMKTVAIVQARMGSTRLPGKVLMKLQNRSVLGHVITRLQAVNPLDEIWVATTNLPIDDVIAVEAEHYGVSVYRGDEQDVLDRYYHTALSAHAQTVVRITSDCPLLDPEITADLIRFYYKCNCDYASNTMKRTFPRGLDVEVFSFQVLETAWRNADQPYEREHVTPYIYLHPEQFRLAAYVGDEDLSHYRWTLDTLEDWELIQIIYERLGQDGKMFTYRDVKDLMRMDPSLAKINAHVEQKKLGE